MPVMSMFAPAPLLRHAGITVAACLLIAAALTALGQGLWDVNLAYSLAIGLISWLSIDLLRLHWRESDEIPWPRGMRGMAVVPLGIAAGLILGNPLGSFYVQQLHPELPAAARPSLWLPLAITMATSIAMSWGFYVVGKSRHLQMQAEQAQRQAAEARFSLLQAQLEPHMLFNTLANLRVLITTDAPRAEQMLDHLIAYLRATLAGSRNGTHSLASEFALLTDYLALMQIRMGDRLTYSLTLPADLAGLPVPPLLLQPLVENSIRHGLEPQLAGGHIAVQAGMLDDRHLLLSVHDNGLGLPALPGQPPSGSGFGLQQIRERLASRYGSAARFDLTADSAGGTRACIVLPLKSQP
ncbi:sensor histidine kinase [Comamonas thiooxydans]|uniref:sensor histidine kinase n=1 Tax=Comamonas thiooxydans TaxID=363952 RepID=UPI001CCC5BAC|nr:histidine kinase [Comamonas thiooxydans]MCO8250818.1 histidine kinase [Comamonas thiooxydans]UBQ44385.1 histidine kinase [Comamonas thiooxydans]